MSIPGDIVIDLNFVPDWARQPAKESSYSYRAGSTSGRARRENKRPQSAKSYVADRDRIGLAPGAGLPGGETEPRPGAAAPAPAESSRQIKQPTASPLNLPEQQKKLRPQNVSPAAWERKRGRVLPKRPLPLKVTFIPESRGLKPLAERLSRSGRAYPLLELAALFISKPDFYAVKQEVKPDGAATTSLFLYQCATCQVVFLDFDLTVAHVLNRHLDLFYAREETTSETPRGVFTCVARCRLSGELLGPPNYHEFNERLSELHRSRFAAMSLAAYRRQIVNETDPALIEQWKKEACRQITYRTLRAAEPLTFQRRSQVEAHFRKHYAPTFIRRSRRFITPGVACRDIEDPLVRQAIEEERARENRFPLKMALAIQSAFRRLGLRQFKASGKATFVTAILPQALDPLRATDDLRRILECLCAHPGVSRQELVRFLQPASAPDAPEVNAILQALRWLGERGHVIEFYNGTLAVPRHQPRPAGENKIAQPAGCPLQAETPGVDKA